MVEAETGEEALDKLHENPEVAIIVPHVSFRYFRKTSIIARLRVVE